MTSVDQSNMATAKCSHNNNHIVLPQLSNVRLPMLDILLLELNVVYPNVNHPNIIYVKKKWLVRIIDYSQLFERAIFLTSILYINHK